MLIHHIEHNHVLHERVILFTVVTEEIPRVPASERIEMESVGEGIFRIIVHYGCIQIPNIPGHCGFANALVWSWTWPE
jgi:KUP system potassium uptake protein